MSEWIAAEKRCPICSHLTIAKRRSSFSEFQARVLGHLRPSLLILNSLFSTYIGTCTHATLTPIYHVLMQHKCVLMQRFVRTHATVCTDATLHEYALRGYDNAFNREEIYLNIVIYTDILFAM